MAKTTKSKSERDSLAKVRDHIKGVEKRLLSANDANERAVTALRSAFETLGKQSNSEKRLEAHVDKLAAHLNGLLTQTRQDVSKDLKSALNNPRIDVITSAVNQANTRLTQAEISQAEAIQKVNQQIARLASALGEQLQTETRERLALDARLTERVDAITNSNAARMLDIEEQTAQAVTSIGERVASLSDELSNRAVQAEDRTQERISEVALDQQHALESFKTETHRELSSIKEEVQYELTPLQRQIATLSARMDSFEIGMDTKISSAPNEAMPPFPSVPSSFGRAEKTTTDLENTAEMDSVSFDTSGDAFTPQTAPVISKPIPAPAVIAQANDAQDAPPVEFNPADYLTPYSGADSNVTPFTPPASFAPAQLTADPAAPPTAHMPPPMPAPDAPFAMQPAATSAASYSDPSYNPYAEASNTIQQPYPVQNGQESFSATAEHNPSMGSARPGAPALVKKPFLSKRTLRTGASAAALVAAVTLGGLMLKDKLIDSEVKTMAQIDETVKNGSSQTANLPSNREPAYDVTLEASTGKMASADGTVQTQGQTSPLIGQPETLEAALATGDPVAQLQKGLSLMQAERPEEAASFIRLAANQGQAAAQYYLGHMYENGQGVPTDSIQARKLTEMAAKSGHRIAMYDTALYYIDGKGGVEVNLGTAAQWFRKAADFGMVDAQYNLAVLHERGTGVQQDLAESYVWFTIAGQNGDQDSAQRAEQIRTVLQGDVLGRAEARIAGFKPAQIDNEVNGVFTNLPWGKPAPIRDPQVVKVQQLLTGLGYEAGIADGAMGPKTRDAIKNFERANSLPETGDVNNALIARLSAASGA